MVTRPSAMILDGNERSALAATRALGRRGFRVVVGDSKPRCLAGVSRYCGAAFSYVSPDENPRGFIRSLKERLELETTDYLLPMSDSTLPLVLSAKDELASTVPFGPQSAFSTLSHKGEVLRLAQEMGVSVPESLQMEPGVDLKRVNDAIDALGGFPVVLKPCRSRVWSGTRYLAGKVKFVSSRRELETIVESDLAFRYGSFLVQEVIEGYGAGLFVLFDKASAAAWFSHRRIRERPPAGGVSTFSESTSLSAPLQSAAEKILRRTGWQGPAMVEFKVAPDGVPYLMEINARFWGSLQLAIDAGIDFPYLSCAQSGKSGEHFERVVSEYEVGTRNRWFLGDVDHLYLMLRGRARLSKKLDSVRAFVTTISDRRSRNEVFRLADIRPGLLELVQYVGRH